MKKTEEKKAFKIAKIEGHIAVWGNLALFAFKFWVGLLTGSVAIIADSWHTLSDSISSIILLVGIRVAEEPADEKHPYGHGRAELIASLFIGVMLVFVGYEFVCKSIEALRAHEAAQFDYLAMTAMVATVVIKEAMAQYALWGARRTGLSSLRADAYHHRSDAISSIIVMVGIGFSWLYGATVWWMDGVLGLIVAAIILYSAWDILRDAASQLMGFAPSADFEKKLKELCDGFCHHDTELHHLHLHDYGTHRELTFHIRLDGEVSLKATHEMVTSLEHFLKEELQMSVTIHCEPRH